MSCCHFGSEGYDCDCYKEEQAKRIKELEMECCLLSEKLRILEEQVDNYEHLYEAEGIV